MIVIVKDSFAQMQKCLHSWTCIVGMKRSHSRKKMQDYKSRCFMLKQQLYIIKKDENVKSIIGPFESLMFSANAPLSCLRPRTRRPHPIVTHLYWVTCRSCTSTIPSSQCKSDSNRTPHPWFPTALWAPPSPATCIWSTCALSSLRYVSAVLSSKGFERGSLKLFLP